MYFSRCARIYGWLLLIVLTCVIRQSADAQTAYSVLRFLGTEVSDGYGSHEVIEASDGKLYGTTPFGGTNAFESFQAGTIFSLNKDGTGFAPLRNFNRTNDGAVPYYLTEGPDGFLYSTLGLSQTNDFGSVFKIKKDGTAFTILHTFGVGTDGSSPITRLVFDSAGYMYGVTYSGGTAGQGTVFRMNMNGTDYTILQNISGNIDSPGALILANNGYLYGTCSGGTDGRGVIFRVGTNGANFSIVYENPFIGPGTLDTFRNLLQATDGLIYGTVGGGTSYGALFRMQLDGSNFGVIHYFTGLGEDGKYGIYLTEGTNGLLYGTSGGGALDYGTVFRVNKDGTNYRRLHSFVENDGVNPYKVIFSGDQTLFGTTPSSGSMNGGTVYTIRSIPSLDYAPQSSTNTAGSTAVFGFLASEFFPMTFQWLKNGTNLPGENGTINSGGGSLVISNVAAANEGSYSVIVSNGYGMVTSMVAALTVVPPAPVEITSSPVGATVHWGSDLTLCVTASGSPPLEYQWRQNGQPVANATNSCFTFSVQNTQSGSYDVVVSNPVDSETSPPVTVALTEPFARLKSAQLADGDGNYPADLIEADGFLYGVFKAGGTNGQGTAFRMNKDGTGFTVLRNFGTLEGQPVSLMDGRNGCLYGTFAYASNYRGAVWKINKDGTGYSVLHYFSGAPDGDNPSGKLILSSSGFLFGTTFYGGAFNYYGTLYKINTNGTGYAVIKDFTSDFSDPDQLVMAPNGTLYGGCGYATIFRVNQDGSAFTTIANFAQNGSEGVVVQTLFQGSDSLLYGSTQQGGTSNLGTIFRLSTNGNSFSVLHHFTPYGANSETYGNRVIEGSDGFLYGVKTYGGATNLGSIFRLDKTGSNFHTLYSFLGKDGANPGSVLFGTNRSLYGTAYAGGEENRGSLFRFDLVPEFTVQPQSRTNLVGTSATFTITASGTLPVTYQWFKNGTNLQNGAGISGVTSNSLTITNVQFANAGDYSVVANNAYGMATSIVATLTVVAGPAIVSFPSGTNTAYIGDNITYCVTVTGTPPFAFLWRRNGFVISGQTNSCLTLSNVIEANSGNYSVRITNLFGVVTSGSVGLIVQAPPSVTTQPKGTNVFLGASATFCATLGGTPTPQFRWLKNGAVIPDATNSCYTIQNCFEADVASYSLLASNQFGIATTLGASLNIISNSSYTELQSFGPTTTNGNYPIDFFEATDGILYGVTYFGGDSNNAGTVFKLNKDGSGFARLANINGNTDSNPYTLIDGRDGAFYGTLNFGSNTIYGSAFKINKTGTGFASIHGFGAGINDGQHTRGRVARASNGILFGVTSGGGTGSQGTAYRIATSGTSYSIIKNFLSTEYNPIGILVGADNALYGISGGGPDGYGNIFKMDTNGANSTVLHSFSAMAQDGIDPFGLFQGADGVLYGITLQGGTNNGGTVFKMTTNGVFTVLKQLAQIPGATASPTTLVEGLDGGLYGTTVHGGISNVGTLYRLNKDGTGFNELRHFGITPSDGVQPSAIVAGSDGAIYVATEAGGAYGHGAIYKFGTRPAINVQPLSRTNLIGTVATFSVNVSGTSPFSYQWLKNGVPLSSGGGYSGTTGTTLSISPVAGSHVANYSVVISNFAGSVTSSVATLWIDGFPIITSFPSAGNNTILAGSSTMFCVTAMGAPPLSYQWLKDNVAIPGQTNDCIGLANVTTAQAGGYSAQVQNSLGQVGSPSANLIVQTPAEITSSPGSTNVNPGESVTLCISATGSLPLLYQWRKNGINILDQTNACITLTNVQAADGGSYDAVVQNQIGAVASAAAIVAVNTPPKQPGDDYADSVPVLHLSGTVTGTNSFATVEPGEPLHAGKVGGKSVWYFWVAPDSGIVTFDTLGSTFDTLLAIYVGTSVSDLTNIVANDDATGGAFGSRVAFNAISNVTYFIAIDGLEGANGRLILHWDEVVTPEEVPVIVQPPASFTVNLGDSHTFSVTPQNMSIVYQFQWYFNGTLLADKTNQTLTITNIQLGDLGEYKVNVMNSARVVESKAASLQKNVTGSETQPVLAYDKLGDAIEATNVLVLGNASGPLGLLAFNAPKRLAGAIVRGYTGSQVFNNYGATTEAGEEIHCGIICGVSEWIPFVARESGSLHVDTAGSAVDTVLAVYVRSNGIMTSVDCNNDSAPQVPTSALEVPVIANQTNFIVVDTVKGVSGLVNVNYNLLTPASLIVPDPVNAGSLTFRVTGHAGQKVKLEASSNIVNWTPLQTNTLIDTFLDITTPVDMNLPIRVFRARTLP